MKLVVYSRKTMEIACPPDHAWAVISICEAGDFPSIYTNTGLLGRLDLKFHDVDYYKNGERPDSRILFDNGLANQVVDFYEKMKSLGSAVMFIHCLVGQCRSPAIVAALEKIEGRDDHVWFATKNPNLRVYDLILEVARERDLLPRG